MVWARKGKVWTFQYAHELTQLFDDVTFEISTLITQELCQGSEDWDVSLP